jgi:hypothetical protein
VGSRSRLLREADHGVPGHVAQLAWVGLRYVGYEPHRQREAMESLCRQQR